MVWSKRSIRYRAGWSFIAGGWRVSAWVGFTIGSDAALLASDCDTFLVAADDPTLSVSADSPTLSVSSDGPTLTVGACG